MKIFFEHQEFEITGNLTVNEHLALHDKMDAPYYITKDKIVLFHQNHIVLFKLAGDFKTWITMLT